MAFDRFLLQRLVSLEIEEQWLVLVAVSSHRVDIVLSASMLNAVLSTEPQKLALVFYNLPIKSEV